MVRFLDKPPRYEDKVDILGRITYIVPMTIVYKAVRDWASTQHRHAHKIRGKGNVVNKNLVVM